jgi:small conductance mechanosensitive channel
MDSRLDDAGWLSAAFWADILRGTVAWAVEALPKVLLVLLLAFVLLKLLKAGCKQLAKRAGNLGHYEQEHLALEHKKRTETLIGIVNKAGVVVIWTLIVMLVLMQIGVNVAPLIAGAGIIGLAIGFGAQELVRDVITGFFILMENQIRNGDVAVINGTGGLVEAMGLRTIVLRDLSGTVHVFQNGKISSLANMTKGWSAMVFDVGVAYKEDTDEVVEVMRQVADELQRDEAFSSKILEPMEVFGVDSFGDSAVVVKARLKTQPIQQWAVGREYNRRLKKAFDERKIEIPFPHRTLYWGEESEPFQLRQVGQNGAPSRPGLGSSPRPGALSPRERETES